MFRFGVTVHLNGNFMNKPHTIALRGSLKLFMSKRTISIHDFLLKTHFVRTSPILVWLSQNNNLNFPHQLIDTMKVWLIIIFFVLQYFLHYLPNGWFS